MDPTLPTFGFNPFDFGAGTAPVPPPPPAAGPLPEVIANFLASKNIPPGQFIRDPASVQGAVAPENAPPLGASLVPTQPLPTSAVAAPGIPLPQPRPAGAGPAATEAAPAGGGFGQRLSDALKGVKAPAAPDVVKPTTPRADVAAPHGQIKGGELFALLQALGAQNPAAKVPLPLGTVLGGRYG